jgi:hypothetical protein
LGSQGGHLGYVWPDPATDRATDTAPRDKWRLPPTFSGVIQWRKNDPPSSTIGCRFAIKKGCKFHAGGVQRRSAEGFRRDGAATTRPNAFSCNSLRRQFVGSCCHSAGPLASGGGQQCKQSLTAIYTRFTNCFKKLTSDTCTRMIVSGFRLATAEKRGTRRQRIGQHYRVHV